MIITVCAGLLFYAALHDVAARTVPNFVSFSLAGLGVVHSSFAQTILLSATITGIVLAVALLVWHLGLFGGGDVKLLASACLLLPPRDVPALLTTIAMIGGMVACFYIAARHVAPNPTRQRRSNILQRIVRAELWRIHRHGSIPYAVAIALGTITQLMRQ